MNNQKTLRKLIQETKGKFFSIEFIKLDGTRRIANGKDKYVRLLADPSNPDAGVSKLQRAGFEPFIDRNKEGWIAARQERVVSFTCGKIHQTF